MLFAQVTLLLACQAVGSVKELCHVLKAISSLGLSVMWHPNQTTHNLMTRQLLPGSANTQHRPHPTNTTNNNTQQSSALQPAPSEHAMQHMHDITRLVYTQPTSRHVRAVTLTFPPLPPKQTHPLSAAWQWPPAVLDVVAVAVVVVALALDFAPPSGL